MEFFGFSSADLATPIGTLIKRASDSLQLGPNWQNNMEICDMVCTAPGREGPEQAVRALTRRLQDSDQKVVSLTLTIAETCMKNCGTHFSSAVSKPLMNEIVNISRGSKGLENRETALRLIQMWAREYEKLKAKLPIFFETYIALKAKGVSFPPEDSSTFQSEERGFEDVIYRDTEKPKLSTAAGATTEPFDREKAEQVETKKLDADLDVVVEKIKLCREMLRESPGIEHDDALADVIGYLEACKDRMTELIEAGAHGLLGEDMLSKALQVNDWIIRTLEAEQNCTLISPDDLIVSQPSKASVSTTGNLLDLDSPKSSSSSAASSISRNVPTTAFTVHTVTDDDENVDSLAAKPLKKPGAAQTGPRKIVPIPPPPPQHGKRESAPDPTSTATPVVAPMAAVDYASQLDELLNISSGTVGTVSELHPNPPVVVLSVTDTKPERTEPSASTTQNDIDTFLASFDESKAGGGDVKL